jgi:hypothetical protein
VLAPRHLIRGAVSSVPTGETPSPKETRVQTGVNLRRLAGTAALAAVTTRGLVVPAGTVPLPVL